MTADSGNLDFKRRLVEATRYIKAGVQSGDYEMRPTRLLLDRHVVDPEHQPLARSMDDISQASGLEYVLPDGRTISQLSPDERSSLVEIEIEQPVKCSDEPDAN